MDVLSESLSAHARGNNRWRELIRRLQARRLAPALGCLRFHALEYRRKNQFGRTDLPPPMWIFLLLPDLTTRALPIKVFGGETVAGFIEYALCRIAFAPPAGVNIRPPAWFNSRDMKAAVATHHLQAIRRRFLHQNVGEFMRPQRGWTLERCGVVAGSVLNVKALRGLLGGGPCLSRTLVRVGVEESAAEGSHESAAVGGAAAAVEQTAVERLGGAAGEYAAGAGGGAADAAATGMPTAEDAVGNAPCAHEMVNSCQYASRAVAR